MPASHEDSWRVMQICIHRSPTQITKENSATFWHSEVGSVPIILPVSLNNLPLRPSLVTYRRDIQHQLNATCQTGNRSGTFKEAGGSFIRLPWGFLSFTDFPYQPIVTCVGHTCARGIFRLASKLSWDEYFILLLILVWILIFFSSFPFFFNFSSFSLKFRL